MNKIIHGPAYDWWRTHNRVDATTAREFKVSRKTIKRWRDAESWEAHANTEDTKTGQKVTEEAVKHLDEGAKAVARARDILNTFGGSVTVLNQQVVNYLRSKLPPGPGESAPAAVDEPQFWVWITATKALVEMTAKLHGIPIKLDLNLNSPPKAPGDVLNEELGAAFTELGEIYKDFQEQVTNPPAKA